MALIDRINELNRHIDNRQYYRLYLGNQKVGFVDTQFLDTLKKAPKIFFIDSKQKRVTLSSDIQRVQLELDIEQFFYHFFKENELSVWRDEKYPLSEYGQKEPLLLIERACLSYLGITGYGVHVNGYLYKKNKIYMWIAKRSQYKTTAPGKLDQIAAGGLPYGLTARENLIKECKEEASISLAIAKKAVSVSSISYWYDLDIGVRPDVLFNYDLLLPDDFIPLTNDGEVDSFELLPIDEVLEIVANTRNFKFNSAAVIIDFAIRHGVITPDCRDYLLLQEGLNQRWKHFLI